MNSREKEIMVNGEKGQGEGLHNLKMRKEGSSKAYGKERSYSKGSNSSRGTPGVVLYC